MAKQRYGLGCAAHEEKVSVQKGSCRFLIYDEEMVMSFLDRLREEQRKLAARCGDPWRLHLERVHGKIGDDGLERIRTQLLFDILEVPQRSRGAGACRRLAKVMAELGWMAVRVRGLTGGGYLAVC
jgi:hypothetical protein